MITKFASVALACAIVLALFGVRTLSQSNESIAGIVVPHHDIVRVRRAQFFGDLHQQFFSSRDPQTIILLSPNHFERGRSNIQTTDRVWHTDQGDIGANKAVIDEAIKTLVASKETESFAREHGITLLLGDIKKTFPNASLVPVIFKRQTQQYEIERLAASFNSLCASCLVVASVDFSHYQPALLGNLHDQLSLRGLQNRDTALLSRYAEVDSPAALVFLAQWATLHHAERFSEYDHTNSGVITGHPDEEATTHLFGWYESGKPILPKKSVTFAVAGDMMFGRAVGKKYEQIGYQKLFDQFGERVFWGVDAALANLEGPLTAQSVRYDPNPRLHSFLFSKKSINALSFLHLHGVSLANNHGFDNGSKGVKETRDLLGQNAIRPIGDPSNAIDASVAYFEGEGLRLAVVGVNAFSDSRKISALIGSLKKDPRNRILIVPHWGTEYALSHSLQQETLAKHWIDAGADAIIGAHPHVIQDVGVYKGKPIVYSLGNFIFDQTFSRDTQQGLIIAGSFDDDGLSLYLFPHQSKRYQPSLLRGKEKQLIIDRITKNINPYRKESEAGTFLFFPKR